MQREDEVSELWATAVATFALLLGLAAVGALLAAGCAPGGVTVAPNADRLVEARLASPEASLSGQAHVESAVTAEARDVASPDVHAAWATSQPAEATAGQEIGAGGEGRQVTINVSASGSGWAAVLAVAAIAAGVIGAYLLLLYLRARAREADARTGQALAARRAEQASAGAVVIESSAWAVAKAVSKMQPGDARDALLAEVGRYMPDRRTWDAFLDRHRLRVHRSGGARSPRLHASGEADARTGAAPVQT